MYDTTALFVRKNVRSRPGTSDELWHVTTPAEAKPAIGSVHSRDQATGYPDHPSASLPPFRNPPPSPPKPYYYCGIGGRARHRSDEVLVGTVTGSSSSLLLLSSKSTMLPDGPGPPRSLR